METEYRTIMCALALQPTAPRKQETIQDTEAIEAIATVLVTQSRLLFSSHLNGDVTNVKGGQIEDCFAENDLSRCSQC
jgi:hypothetical protein